MERLQRRRKPGQIGLAALQPQAHQPQRREQPARRRIGRQLAKERLGVDGGVEQGAKRLGIQKQQPVRLQIRRGIRPANADEMRVIRGQRGREVSRRLLGDLRRGAIDHRHQHVLGLRKGAIKGHRMLPPGQRFREQLVSVGGHTQPGRRHPQAKRGEHDADQNRQSSTPAGTLDDGGKQGGEEHRGGFIRKRRRDAARTG